MSRLASVSDLATSRPATPRFWPRPSDQLMPRSQRNPWLPPEVVVVEQPQGRHCRPDDALVPAEALDLAEGFELVRSGGRR